MSLKRCISLFSDLKLDKRLPAHRLFSLWSHRLNTSGPKLQQTFFRSGVSASEFAPGRYLQTQLQSPSCELVPSCWNGLGFSFAQLPKSFTISQPTKKHCKPTASVSQSLEPRIYVFNHLPLVFHRLYWVPVTALMCWLINLCGICLLESDHWTIKSE